MSTGVRTLRLERPLAVIDLETTGIDPGSDRIVEIAIVRVEPDGRRNEKCRRINPCLPIPEGATRIHGITDADVADQPTFRNVARSLLDFLDGCDFAGFGIQRFDLPLLQAEFRRCGLVLDLRGRAVIDAMRIFHRYERRDLEAAYRFYCGKEHEKLHEAAGDAGVVLEILEGQLARYPDLPEDVDALADALGARQNEDWVDPEGRLIWEADVVVLNFGKHQGRPLSELAIEERDYLLWILDQDFHVEVKSVIAQVINGEPPRRGD